MWEEREKELELVLFNAAPESIRDCVRRLETLSARVRVCDSFEPEFVRWIAQTRADLAIATTKPLTGPEAINLCETVCTQAAHRAKPFLSDAVIDEVLFQEVSH